MPRVSATNSVSLEVTRDSHSLGAFDWAFDSGADELVPLPYPITKQATLHACLSRDLEATRAWIASGIDFRDLLEVRSAPRARLVPKLVRFVPRVRVPPRAFVTPPSVCVLHGGVCVAERRARGAPSGRRVGSARTTWAATTC